MVLIAAIKVETGSFAGEITLSLLVQWREHSRGHDSGSIIGLIFCVQHCRSSLKKAPRCPIGEAHVVI